MKMQRSNEDEYIFVPESQQCITEQQKELQGKSDAEKRRLKEPHWMHCPKCGRTCQRRNVERWRLMSVRVARVCGWTWAHWAPS